MILEAPLVSPTANVVAAVGHDHAPSPVEAPDESGYGWAMFIAFTAAVVGISVVVAVLALIGSWVMLGVAMAVHILVTATMMKLVLGAFGSEDHAYPDMHRAEAVSRAAIARRAAASGAARSTLALEL